MRYPAYNKSDMNLGRMSVLKRCTTAILIAAAYLLVVVSVNGFHNHGCNGRQFGEAALHCRHLAVECPACAFLLTAQPDVPALSSVVWQPVSLLPAVEQAVPVSGDFIREHPPRSPPLCS